jgi:23S rRNA pseudouridine2605 synthase
MPEKSPRQPRKPFQNTGRRVSKKSPAGSRQSSADSRQSSVGRRKFNEESPVKKVVRKKSDYSEERGEGRRSAADSRQSAVGSRQSSTGRRKFNEERPVKKVARKKTDYSEESEEGRRLAADSRQSAVRGGEKRRPDVERASGERRPRVEQGEKSYRPKRRAGTSRPEDESRPVQSLSPKKYPSRRGVKFKPNSEKDGIRLNKYIANAGICSRREADELIQAGVIKINGVVVTTLGSKVMPGDKVQYGEQTISNEKKRYLLLNKQKGYVTTTKDPHAKNTVMELIEGACKERIYPVGRLDRNTTGLLLFTNDGELAKKLMHPSSRIKKLYHVVLDQPVSKADMLKIAEGLVLDDEKVQIDSIAYVEDAKDRREIGMELHSGQNRVVRRIFESLGYKVTKLDRVVYAGLTKKGILRGKWRFLDEQEVIRLKMLK